MVVEPNQVMLSNDTLLLHLKRKGHCTYSCALQYPVKALLIQGISKVPFPDDGRVLSRNPHPFFSAILVSLRSSKKLAGDLP